MEIPQFCVAVLSSGILPQSGMRFLIFMQHFYERVSASATAHICSREAKELVIDMVIYLNLILKFLF